MVLCVTMAAAVLAASFVVFLVREAESRSKHVQVRCAAARAERSTTFAGAARTAVGIQSFITRSCGLRRLALVKIAFGCRVVLCVCASWLDISRSWCDRTQNPCSTSLSSLVRAGGVGGAANSLLGRHIHLGLHQLPRPCRRFATCTFRSCNHDDPPI